MKFFSTNKNKKIRDLENKVNNLQSKIDKNFDNIFGGYYGEYSRNSNYSLSIKNAIKLYRECSPFYMVIDKIINSYAEIPFKLFDTKNKQYVDEHPVLDLLQSPNLDETEFSFKENLASLFLITGNAFLMCTGDINSKPLEIFNLSPLFFSPFQSSSSIFNMHPKSWQYSNMGSINFEAEETLSGLRYYNYNDKELWHIKKFNPHQLYSSFFGMSKAYPLFNEMESYMAGVNNNASLLKNGARPSVAWVNNRGEELTDAQFERIKNEARKYSGSDNAGSTPILDGMDIKEMSQNNRDMQFKELQDVMLSRIANVYGVPLALLLDSSMTLNNLQTARLHLDKDAVIPLAKRINAELTRFLMPRYADSENLEFSIDVSQIESLKPEVLQNSLLMKETGVNTANEIRANNGYLPIDGGDELTSSYFASNFDSLTNEDNNNDNDENYIDGEEDEKSYLNFCQLMKKENLSDDEIKALWVLSSSK